MILKRVRAVQVKPPGLSSELCPPHRDSSGSPGWRPGGALALLLRGLYIPTWIVSWENPGTSALCPGKQRRAVPDKPQSCSPVPPAKSL